MLIQDPILIEAYQVSIVGLENCTTDHHTVVQKYMCILKRNEELSVFTKDCIQLVCLNTIAI